MGSNPIPCTITFSFADRDTVEITPPRKPVPASVIADGLRAVRSSGSVQTPLIDIRACDLTLSQVMETVRLFAFALPRHEIFMDGDSYAIVARARVNEISTKGALN